MRNATKVATDYHKELKNVSTDLPLVNYSHIVQGATTATKELLQLKRDLNAEKASSAELRSRIGLLVQDITTKVAVEQDLRSATNANIQLRLLIQKLENELSVKNAEIRRMARYGKHTRPVDIATLERVVNKALDDWTNGPAVHFAKNIETNVRLTEAVEVLIRKSPLSPDQSSTSTNNSANGSTRDDILVPERATQATTPVNTSTPSSHNERIPLVPTSSTSRQLHRPHTPLPSARVDRTTPFFVSPSAVHGNRKDSSNAVSMDDSSNKKVKVIRRLEANSTIDGGVTYSDKEENGCAFVIGFDW